MKNKENILGKKIFRLAKILWPLNRSIIGEGFRQSLKILKKQNKELKVLNFKTGSKVFDWTVPKEWKINEAYIITPDNKKICDYKTNNLHLVQYSQPINKIIDLSQLKKKIYYLKKQPNAIPYVTSYYKKDWGFCLDYKNFKKLKKGKYKVLIKSKFINSSLNIGELFIKGISKKEILISTYLCHPSMANNELSGPIIASEIAKWLKKKKRNYSYRFLFLPETIGSICYLSKNYKTLKKNLISGFNLSCLGDEKNYSIIVSRNGNSLSDKVAKSVLKKLSKSYKVYNWNYRASDERQYCSPGIDLPVTTLMKTKFGSYKEYHTSLDKLGTVVTEKGLQEGFKFVKNCLENLENEKRPISKILCEPFMSKRKLYSTLGGLKTGVKPKIMDILTWCDGTNDISELAKKAEISLNSTKKVINILKKQKIISHFYD